jgi:ribosomal protein S18 acetylase RimI-like enzyme
MPSIIASLQELARENHRLVGPRAAWHIGDLAWGLGMYSDREHDWEFRVWDDGGRTVGWSWLRLPEGELDHDVHPAHRHLLDEMLDVPRASKAFGFAHDDEEVAALARHGFTVPDTTIHFNARSLDGLPEQPPLPDGFRLRTVEPGDVPERVAVHRDAFAPSRVTEEGYMHVQASWPYRASLDCIVEAPDGRIAAFALLWPDDENGVGELEPVGTRTDFRRLGLAAAVCMFALHRWRGQGGRSAIVYCSRAPACALYRSLGFEQHSSIVGYSR